MSEPPAPPSPASQAPRLIARLERLGAQSPVCKRLLASLPEAEADLLDLPPVRSADAWQRWLTHVMSRLLSPSAPPVDPSLADLLAAARSSTNLRFEDALRLARRRAYLTIISRELETANPLDTGHDVSGLAAACLELALARARDELHPRYGAPLKADGTPCRAVIMGLGKLGGDELNLSSDVDLIYAYETDSGQTCGASGLGQRVPLHTYFSRLFMRVTALLNEQSEHGFVFRVDLDLRPEGRTGSICNSVDALESYYETFGHSWERLAWIKGRPVAGDLDLGETLLATLRPFVFRRTLDHGLPDEIAAMKRRIDANAARTSHRDGFNVKLGHGGIREIEFTAQTLQLVWGGRLTELRTTSTLSALTRLSAAGLMDESESQALIAAYRFLRHVEHALQWGEERQTQWLDGEGPERRRVIAALRLSEEAFSAALAEHRQKVRRVFSAIVEGVGPTSTEAELDLPIAQLLEPEAPAEARAAIAAELGFLTPEATVTCVDTLTRRPQSPFHWRTRAEGGPLSTLSGRVIRACLASAAPDQALRHFEGFFRVIEHRRQALAQLAEDPQRLRVLATLFGTSQTLSRLLIRSPGLIDRLVLDGHEPPVRDRAALTALIREEIALYGGDWEGALAAVRRVHAAETLRIGFFDLAGLLDTVQVTAQLSLLAEVIVAAIVAAASRDIEARFEASVEGFGVLAFGKLAARELGYRSDLDLLFIHAPDTQPHIATRLARAVITGLSCATPEGVLYDIDTRLRPSGNQGPLCISGARFLEYHRTEAATWEKQAALRLRAIVGGPPMQALVDAVRALALGAFAGRPERARVEVADMRARLAQTAGEGDLKLGRGGLVDAEFLVQLLQLTLPAEHVRADSPACSASVMEALAGLDAAGAFAPYEGPNGGDSGGALAPRLLEAYAFLRRLENRLAIVQEHPHESLRLLAAEAGEPEVDPQAQARLRRLSLRMGYGDAGSSDPTAPALALRADYRRHRATIERATSEIFGSSPHGH